MNVINSRTYSKDLESLCSKKVDRLFVLERTNLLVAISEARAIGFHATAAALTEMLRNNEEEC